MKKIVFTEDPERRGFHADDVLLAVESKTPEETIFHTIGRLERAGKIPVHRLPEVERRMIAASGIKAFIREKGYRVGEGVVEAVEKALVTILEFSVAMAKMKHRKTVQVEDVK